MGQEHRIRGIHHITLVAGSASRTAHFYTQILGLQFVKRTVNFDRPDTYHLYFGGETGEPGTLVTFFEWPDAPPSRMGLGSVHHFSLTVRSMDGLLKWKTWLQHHHLLVAGPFDHGAYLSVLVTDPDGVVVEIATSEPGWSAVHTTDNFLPLGSRLAADTWPEPVLQITEDMRLGLIHHIAALTSDIERTDSFYRDVLGLSRIHTGVDPDMGAAPRWYWSTGEDGEAGLPGTLILYTQPQSEDVPIRGQVGHGMTHHFAFAVDDDDALSYWQGQVRAHDLAVTDILDRKYFHSIYFHDPDGILIEIATSTPGFLVDEPANHLGEDLMLPSWLETRREVIEAALEPIDE